MKPTDTTDPRHYHRVVDCQWGCPAHTNVPEYIRLIAQGRYTESYLLNRKSNVFPGILGRTCDRPCEPACRRGRLDGEPVAICRLKRVAADLRDEIRPHLPSIPRRKNGRRIACVGAGPASLTLANDLMPLGYEVTIFERLPQPGGLMWTNIPEFRLPARVLREEIGYIVDMGVDLRLNTPIDSLGALLQENFDAIFVGSGAPKGRDLDLPGRLDSEQVHVGIDWLAAIRFGHVTRCGERVLVIGVGNTAMDCCRTAQRLGAKSVRVMAREAEPQFKASPWELEDALEEQVEIIENHSPARFIVEEGRLVAMEFNRVRWSPDAKGRLQATIQGSATMECDEAILAIGLGNSFPWIERDIGIDFNRRDVPIVDRDTFMTSRPGVFMGGDAAWGPENIIWAIEHGHQAAISIHAYCEDRPLTDRPPVGMNLVSQKMGLHEWSYSNDFDEAERVKMRHVDLEKRFRRLDIEVEEGFDVEQTLTEVERCLNCDIQTHFEANLCIECDACIDICPLDCLTITHNGPARAVVQRLSAPRLNPDQPLFASEELPQTGRIMVKDEDLCIHCGLCAERCPTAAWDMRKSDLLVPYAGLAAGESHPVPSLLAMAGVASADARGADR